MKQKVKHSKLLVIDACVAGSAGETEHPVSSACRKCLCDVFKICHRMAVTETILKEWDKHQSGFALKWRGSMLRHGKLKKVTPVSVKLNLAAFNPKNRAAVLKDIHLIEAALAADKLIITLDTALLRALDSAQQGRNLRDRIAWHNPVTEKDSPL